MTRKIRKVKEKKKKKIQQQRLLGLKRNNFLKTITKYGNKLKG